MSKQNIGLAGTWNPRGELSRMIELLPRMSEIYAGITLVVPPQTDIGDLQPISSFAGVQVIAASDWSWGRHLALEKNLEYPIAHIHYADMDRLLRWIETRPAEWLHCVQALPGKDCVIHGRSEGAYRTHPQAIIRTEAISNRVFSQLLGQPVDLSAGSKGFSRKACEYLVANSPPGSALGMDARWPMMLYEAGYPVEMVWVEGLDWESADRYRTAAADAQRQKQLAEAYDRDAENWAYRVEVAMEIVNAGLNVIDTSLDKTDC